MKFGLLRAVAAVATAGLLILQPSVPLNAGPATAHAFSYASLTKMQKRLLSGFAEYELNPQSAARQAATGRSTYFPFGGDSCPTNLGGDVKVN
jgi:hypothetical protein